MRAKFYFDISSLQSWILFEQLVAAERALSIRAEFTPVRAPALYTQTGARNPYYTLAIRRYLFNEVDYLRRLYGVPFEVPQDAERKLSSIGTSSAQHFLTRIQQKHPDKLKEAARVLWRRLWVQQGEVSGDEDFKFVLRELTLPSDSIAAAPDAESETRLKEAELEVVSHGGFDVPFVVVQDGQQVTSKHVGMDSWPLIAKHLQIPPAQRSFYGLRSSTHFLERTDPE